MKNFSLVIPILGAMVLFLPLPGITKPIEANNSYLLTQKQQKLRVAILDFDYSSVTDPRWLSLVGGAGGSTGVSDILVNKLVENGNYSVIERSRIDAVLKEQNFGASGRVDASTAAQIGKILGVDVVIIGSITQFDLQSRQSGVNVFGLFGQNKKETDAFVKLNVRMVNTTTAEILAVAEGNGTANQSDTSTAVLGVGSGSATSNESKLLTIATTKAVDQVITSIDSKSEVLSASPRSIPSVNALVAAIAGNQVILNKGSANGYRVGLRVSIERVSQQVKDPATGKVIRQITQPLGIIEITEVDAESSVGKIISGTTFKIGDLAKPTR
jgi:curli biogenesis system outer membrane secretion channel CsgG